MNELIDYLEQLDLSEAEAKLYLTLLKSGPLSVRDLASAVDIKRTTAYMHIDQLIEKGLIMKLIKKSKKLVAANDPKDNLKHLVEKKIKLAKDAENELPKVLKKIHTELPEVNYAKDAEIRYFKGINAVRKIYQEAFNGNEFRSYVKVEEAPLLSSDNPDFFSEAFKKNKNLKVWEIMYDSPASRRQVFKMISDNYSYYYKFMPSELKWSLTSEDILIFDGKVAIINYSGSVSTVVLQSPDFYNNSKEIFDFIWRMLPETSS